MADLFKDTRADWFGDDDDETEKPPVATVASNTFVEVDVGLFNRPSMYNRPGERTVVGDAMHWYCQAVYWRKKCQAAEERLKTIRMAQMSAAGIK